MGANNGGGNPYHDPKTGQFISGPGTPVDYGHYYDNKFGVRSTTPKKDEVYEVESSDELIALRREEAERKRSIEFHRKEAERLNSEEKKRDIQKSLRYKIGSSHKFSDGNRYTVIANGEDSSGSVLYWVKDESGNTRVVSEEELNHKKFKS